MKKVAKWLAAISIVVFVIAWGIMGLKILDNRYVFYMYISAGLILLPPNREWFSV